MLWGTMSLILICTRFGQHGHTKQAMETGQLHSFPGDLNQNIYIVIVVYLF